MYLKSNVTRFKPRRGSYEEALVAFSSGDFLTCVDFLADSVADESAILRSRALIRLGDADAAVESLVAHDFSDASHEVAAEALAVRSYGLHVLKRPADAAAVGCEARARCFSSGLVGLEAELLFATAVGAMFDVDYDEADAAAISVLGLVDDSPSWMTPKTYAYSLQFWRARACELRGIVAAVGKNYAEYASWMLQAFAEFDRSGVRDEYTHAHLLANYADTAITHGSGDVVAFVIERAERIAWNASLVDQEFRIFSTLAEACSASGDQLSALRYFRRCLDCAPNAALQIRASVERGRLLHEIGESFAAREELDHALRLSKSVDWESAGELEQRELIFLAGQIARYEPKHAERLLSRYDGLVCKAQNGVAIKDDRFRGEEFMARAAVMHAIGQKERAVLLLMDAFETFTAAKLTLKAANAAAELAASTGEVRYVEIARLQSIKQPNSILARKVTRLALPVTVSKPKLSLLS